MTLLVSLYNSLFGVLERGAGNWLLPTLARLIFAGTLLLYFWAAAVTKLGDGIFGFIALDMGAYIQMFPKQFEAVGYDASQLGLGYKLIAIFGTWAEFILPLMIVLGALARLAALGMIAFVIVQSVTDIVGHNADAETVGAWFDRASDALILDQRAFWVFALLFLVIKGPGPAALDRFLLARPRRGDAATEATPA